MHSKINQNDLRLHLKRTSKQSQEPQMVQNAFKKQSKLFEAAPQTHLKAISIISNGSTRIQKNKQSCLRLHLKRTSKQAQEPPMVQNAFKTQSKLCEAAHQTHTKAISRISNRPKVIQNTITTI